MMSNELEKINRNICEFTEDILPDNELIYFLNNGSKRIRAKLAILLIKAFDKNIDEKILDILTAGELIHNASLLHDDVIDESELRRGRTTLGKKYSSKISILCGDYVVSRAINILLRIDNKEISDKFNDCVKNMASAEIKQYFQRNKCADIETYIDICRGKTANLFSVIFESCAIYLNLNRKIFSDFGEIFGIYFQLKNDMEKNSAEEDKKNKICTAENILGIENALALSDNYKQRLRDLLKMFPENEYVLELEDIINKL